MLDRGGDIDARRGSDGFDRLPAFAEHDLALAFALDIDRLLDANRAVPQLLPYLGLDRRVVGQFLVQPQIKLLPGDLGGKLAQRRVRDLILGVKPRAFRHAGGEKAFEIGDAVAGPSGNHEGRGERRPLVERLRQREKLALLHQVDFVEHQDFGRADVGELAQDRLLVLLHAFVRVDRAAQRCRHPACCPRRCPPWRGRAAGEARKFPAYRRRSVAPCLRSRCRE